MYITFEFKMMLHTERLGVKYFVRPNFFYKNDAIDIIKEIDREVEFNYITEIQRKCGIEMNWMLNQAKKAYVYFYIKNL